MFSIFEEYTEWITKGKLHPNVELGKKLAITTDQYNLIVDYRIMDHQSDSEIVRPLAERLTALFDITSWSFDKGFWTPNNLKRLSEFVPLVVLPKKGKLSQADTEREGEKEFGKTRKWHAGVESAGSRHSGCYPRVHETGLGWFRIPATLNAAA